jgi:glycosyltransferase involved in cell wall biosynthesis
MKIIYLLDDFPPKSYSSVSMIAFNLTRGLLELGHEIFVITRTGKKNEQGEENYQGIKIFRIYSQYPSLLRHWLAVFNPQTILKVKRILKEIRPDVCHFHHIHAYLSYYCLKLAKKYSKKVFITAHDVMFFHYGKLMPKNENVYYRVSILDQIKEARKRYNPFRNIVIKHYLKYTDKIFTVSNALKKVLEINGIKNIETIYNGIDVSKWQANRDVIENFKNEYNLENKKVINFAARLIEAKGGDQLIRSLALVNKEFPYFLLLVIGKEWVYTEKLKQIADKLGIKNKIIFTGFLKEEELKIAYHSTDISVFPSLCFETFGMGNLEAMACKKPVISSFFGGPSEVVVDGETGYLINPNDVELMAEKILYLLKNSQKAKQFGEEGYLRAKEVFSLDRQVEETLKWYNKFLKN